MATLTLSLPLWLREQLSEYAMAHGIPMAEVVGDALLQYFATAKPPGYTRALAEAETAEAALVTIATTCRALFPALDPIANPLKPYLYFIHAEGTEYYKIGHSMVPESRLVELQVGNMFRLHLVSKLLVGNACMLEQHLHSALFVFRGHGEWYRLPALFISYFLPETYPQH